MKHSTLLVLPLVLFALLQTTNSKAYSYLEQEEVHDFHVDLADTEMGKRLPPKEWTFIVYMAADNDLAQFSRKNLLQLTQIGSNEHINIVVHLDTRTPTNQKITKRYYVEKDKLVVLYPSKGQEMQPMDSGDPQTLINACHWAVNTFPAHHYALVFWNHGTGCIDVGRPRSIGAAQLFDYNPLNNLVELNRNVEFLEYIMANSPEEPRGICFDDSTGHYINNQGLEQALRIITQEILGGKKFRLIAFDACLMAMLEVASIIKEFADFMVSSQEVELGPGYSYDKLLEPFENGVLDGRSFAEHIVRTYEGVYSKITQDYTQSALDLTLLGQLEKNVDHTAQLLLNCMLLQKNNMIDKTIRVSRHKLLCTHFDEPSYIDLDHFYGNLLENMNGFEFLSEKEDEGNKLKKQLKQTLEKGRSLIQETVFANCVGRNLSKARGISIYFPERRIHTSYPKMHFAKTTKWLGFVSAYLLSCKI